MEAEYVRERRRRRTVVLIGVILAILAAGATYFLVTRGGGAQAPAQKTIVVASVLISAQTLIEADDVELKSVPDSTALTSAITSESAVVGRVARVEIPVGAPIFPSMVGEGTAGGLNIIPVGEELTPDSPAWRAVSVNIPSERAVAGLPKIGDHVDLFATIKIAVYDPTGASSDNALLPQGYYSDFTTKVSWLNLEILQTFPEKEQYVLRVDEHQAEEIAHVQGAGANSFTMSLRAQADARDIDRSGYGETTNRILEQYNFPIPQIIFLDSYPQPEPQPSPFVPGPGVPPPPTLSPVGSPPPASPEASPSP